MTREGTFKQNDTSYCSLLACDYLKNKTITVTMDRPLGTAHPNHPDMIYPINYGYVEGIIAPDNEEQDVYVLGIDIPLEKLTGKLIAIIHRKDDVETKWVTCPDGMSFTTDEIASITNFQEKYYDSYITMIE